MKFDKFDSFDNLSVNSPYVVSEIKENKNFILKEKIFKNAGSGTLVNVIIDILTININ